MAQYLRQKLPHATAHQRLIPILDTDTLPANGPISPLRRPLLVSLLCGLISVSLHLPFRVNLIAIHLGAVLLIVGLPIKLGQARRGQIVVVVVDVAPIHDDNLMAQYSPRSL